MRSIPFFLLLISCVTSADSEPVTAGAVSRFLSRQKVIRLGVDWGAGLGHQSAGATVARRLRALGYRGEIEVVYDLEYHESTMPSKMSAVFPGFDADGPPVQRLPSQKMSFVPETVFRERTSLVSPVELAIMGADDRARGPGQFKSRLLLTLQPLGWKEPATLRLLDRNGRERLVDLSHLKARGVHFEIGETLPRGHEVDSRGLRILDRSLDRLDLAPYYGHGLYRNVIQLHQYVSAIATAIARAPRLFNRGVVVPIFMTTDELHREELARVVAEVGPMTKLANVTDADFENRLRRLAPGEIMIVEAGLVSRELFEYFFARATVPPVTGGRNSMNLMGQTGRPYLTSNARESYHFAALDSAKFEPEPAADASALVWRVREIMVGEDLSFEAISTLAEFITRARDPGSSLERFFRRRKIATGFTNDSVAAGLRETVRYLSPRLRRATFSRRDGYARRPAAESCAPALL